MSTLRVNTLQDATGSDQPAMAGAAKAWVNFNGTGTVAIREQFNVSSITDNGTGDYTVNFTTAMPDTKYTASFLSNQTISRTDSGSQSINSLRMITGRIADFNGNMTLVDTIWAYATFFR